MNKVYAVIMAGGSGTRFWPLSRKKTPKQFLAIGTEQPLIVETIQRLAPIIQEDHVRIVAGMAHTEKMRDELKGLSHSAFITEPCARNTAPCIGLAAIHLAHENPDALMAVLPSDHHIGDAATYRSLVKLALERASLGEVVTLGIEPSRPETGYGYIEFEEQEDVRSEDHTVSIKTVLRFVEKPDVKTAESYVEAGRYLWNSGMFFFSARTILKAYADYLPEMYSGLMTISESIGTAEYSRVLRSIFEGFESISFDYGIMEPLSQRSKPSPIRVIPASIGWNDVGHWAALKDFASSDEVGNVVEGDAILIESENNIVHGDSGLIALVGVHDLVVVQTDDAVLVMPKNRAQDVRSVVDALKSQGKDELL